MKTIAIISTNSYKYSETFIHRQIQELSMPVVLYTDGYLPTQISLDRGQTSQPIPKTWWQASDASTLLKKSFVKHKVKAVLTQYGPSGVAVMKICKDLGIPLIVHFHGYDAFRNDILNSYGKEYLELFRTAAAIIAVSNPMETQLKALGCPSEKLHKLIYGIDTQLFFPNKNVSKSKHHFVACGRFVPKKAPFQTLKAFAQVVQSYPSASLTFIGDGELVAATKELTVALNIAENVHFTGVLSPEAVAKAYQNANCFIQHSVTTEDNDSEGTPLTILEAMSSGLPIVATAHGGIPQVVDHGVTGYLVSENDTEQMASFMKQIMESPDRATQMGIQGRERATKDFTKEQYLKKLTNIIDNCIG